MHMAFRTACCRGSRAPNGRPCFDLGGDYRGVARYTTGNAVAEQKCDDFCSGTNVSVPEQYFRSVMVLITVFHSGTENDANCCGTV